MNSCHSCNCNIETCLSFTEGKKCCPDCVCSLIDKGIQELDESINQLNNIPDDEKFPSEDYWVSF